MRSKFEKVQILLVHLPQFLWYVIQLTAKSNVSRSSRISTVVKLTSLCNMLQQSSVSNWRASSPGCGLTLWTTLQANSQSQAATIKRKVTLNSPWFTTMGHKEICSFTCLPIIIWLTSSQVSFLNSDKSRWRNIILSEPQGLYRKTWNCFSPNFINFIVVEELIHPREHFFLNIRNAGRNVTDIVKRM